MNWAQIYSIPIAAALLLVFSSLWAATQWAAGKLGYQPALGSPWLEFLGLKIYAPWSLFRWWLAFDTQAPDVFARAGVVAALGGVASGVVALGGAARRTSRKVQSDTYGSAPWADVGNGRKANPPRARGIVLGTIGRFY